MLRAAIVGVGFMGWIHYLAYQRSTAVRLAAFCSRDAKKRAGDWRGIQGNFGPPGRQIAVEALSVYETIEQVLDDPSIDLVDICLPPSLHADVACRALEAGKHVLCEKPLALNTADCDRIVQAAQSAGRRALVAQVLPFMGEFEYAFQAANDLRYGKLRRGYFKRVISPPDWIPDFYEPDSIGGPLIDLHVHDTHFVRLTCGMPKRVMASAELRRGIVKFCHTLMEFEEPGMVVGTSSGVSDQTARPFCHGFEIQFEQALLNFELAVLRDRVDSLPLRVLGLDGQMSQPELAANDEVAAFAAELDEAALAISEARNSPRLDAEVARDAIHICQCLQQSALSGEWVNCASTS